MGVNKFWIKFIQDK